MLSRANCLKVSVALILAFASLLAGCGGGSGAGELCGSFVLTPTGKAAADLNGSTVTHVLKVMESGNAVTGTLDGAAGWQVNGTTNGPRFALRLTRNGQNVGFLNGEIINDRIIGTLAINSISVKITGTHPP